jgi:hypothetical protein
MDWLYLAKELPSGTHYEGKIEETIEVRGKTRMKA